MERPSLKLSQPWGSGDGKEQAKPGNLCLCARMEAIVEILVPIKRRVGRGEEMEETSMEDLFDFAVDGGVDAEKVGYLCMVIGAPVKQQDMDVAVIVQQRRIRPQVVAMVLLERAPAEEDAVMVDFLADLQWKAAKSSQRGKGRRWQGRNETHSD